MMTALEEEIALAEEKWVHEVIEELEDELALETNFESCIHETVPA